MNWLKKGLLVFFMILSSPSFAYYYGVRSFGMGGSGLAYPSLSDAVFLNASALAFAPSGFEAQARYNPWYSDQEAGASIAYSKNNSGIGLGYLQQSPFSKTQNNSSGDYSYKTYQLLGSIGALFLNKNLAIGFTPSLSLSLYQYGSLKVRTTELSLQDISFTINLGGETYLGFVFNQPTQIPEGKVLITGGLWQDFGKYLSNATDLGIYYSKNTSQFAINLSTGFEIRTNDLYFIQFGYLDSVTPSGQYSESNSGLQRSRYIFIGNSLNLGKALRLDIMANAYRVSQSVESSKGILDTLSASLTAHL